jgi:hypothetical protein
VRLPEANKGMIKKKVNMLESHSLIGDSAQEEWEMAKKWILPQQGGTPLSLKKVSFSRNFLFGWSPSSDSQLGLHLFFGGEGHHNGSGCIGAVK